MRENNYPLYEEHQQEHECFAKRALELQALLLGGSHALDLEIMQFLKDWLADHILNSDKKFGFYLISGSQEY